MRQASLRLPASEAAAEDEARTRTRLARNDAEEDERLTAAAAAAVARVQIVAGNILVRLATQMEWETDGTPLLDEVDTSIQRFMLCL
jgi:hypothetical protein